MAELEVGDEVVITIVGKVFSCGTKYASIATENASMSVRVDDPDVRIAVVPPEPITIEQVLESHCYSESSGICLCGKWWPTAGDSSYEHHVANELRAAGLVR